MRRAQLLQALQRLEQELCDGGHGGAGGKSMPAARASLVRGVRARARWLPRGCIRVTSAGSTLCIGTSLCIEGAAQTGAASSRRRRGIEGHRPIMRYCRRTA